MSLSGGVDRNFQGEVKHHYFSQKQKSKNHTEDFWKNFKMNEERSKFDIFWIYDEIFSTLSGLTPTLGYSTGCQCIN